jgi:hypothetical protein
MDSGAGEFGKVADAPTQELGSDVTRELPAAPAAEDRCSACGSPLLHDQRYCVECGERRGQSRFPVAQPATEAQAGGARPVRRRRPSTVSSGTTLVAGVGVLLLAIGLGVLIGRIGHTGNTGPTRAPAPQVITVQGGGGGVAATTPTTRTTAVHVNKKQKAKLNSAAKATAPPPAAVQKKAAQAASKVLGNGNNLPPPTSTVGQKCTGNQTGCSGGKFTGNYFGP